MSIWTSEIKELNQIYLSIKGTSPKLEKELGKLVTTDDENMLLVYSRRCLEVIITELCEHELSRDRGTEPLQGIIDKLNKEKIVPHNIIVAMQGVNSMSTFGAHPKDFESEQVKPVLNNLKVVIKWYIKNREHQLKGIDKLSAQQEDLKTIPSENKIPKRKKRVLIYSILLLLIVAVWIIVETGIFSEEIERSVAVLPFRNDSPEDSTQYFMDGVMEELLNKLQLIESLRVIGRTSVEQYRGQDKSIKEIAKELGVNFIVEGSGQKSGNALRMRVQLLTAKNERHLWGDSFEQENLKINDYFKAQSGFAEAIANKLNAALSAQEEKRIKKVPSVNMEAYEAYLKSNIVGDLSPDALLKAKEYLEDAIKNAPDWAPLYSAMAITWLSMSATGAESPDIANPLVYENLNKALELDPEAENAHYISAFMARTFEWDWEKAESEFLKQIAINPNHALARLHYAAMLYALQRTEEAGMQAELGYKLDPLNPLVQSVYAATLIMGGDCKSAMSVVAPLLEKEPDNALANAQLWAAAWQCGDLDLLFSINITGITFLTQDEVSEIQKIYNEKGFYAAYSEIVMKLEILAEKAYIPNNSFAFMYYIINNDEKALDYLEKAVEAHENITNINTKYLGFPRLYNNPRFIEILNKMNLPLPKTE
jgi:TolB-like protein